MSYECCKFRSSSSLWTCSCLCSTLPGKPFSLSWTVVSGDSFTLRPLGAEVQCSLTSLVLGTCSSLCLWLPLCTVSVDLICEMFLVLPCSMYPHSIQWSTAWSFIKEDGDINIARSSVSHCLWLVVESPTRFFSIPSRKHYRYIFADHGSRMDVIMIWVLGIANETGPKQTLAPFTFHSHVTQRVVIFHRDVYGTCSIVSHLIFLFVAWFLPRTTVRRQPNQPDGTRGFAVPRVERQCGEYYEISGAPTDEATADQPPATEWGRTFILQQGKSV